MQVKTHALPRTGGAHLHARVPLPQFTSGPIGMLRAVIPLIVISVALSLMAPAEAVSIGRVRTVTTLGQPLNLTIPLRLDDGETLDVSCAFVEVLTGDVRVPEHRVQTRLEPGASLADLSLRVQTLSVMDEPVITVTVNLGCPARMTRRVVLFADPAEVVAAQMAPVPLVAATAAPVPTPVATPPIVAAPAPLRTGVERAASNVTIGPSSEEPGGVRAARRGQPKPTAARAAEPRAAVRVAPAPRLRLDPPVPTAAERLLLAQADAAEAAAAAASAVEAANVAAAARLAALEESLLRTRAQAKEQQEVLLALRARVDEAEAASIWVTVLMAVTALLAALVAWLTWKLRRRPKAVEQVWWDSQMHDAPHGTQPGAHETAPAALTRSEVTQTVRVTAPSTAAARSALIANESVHEVSRSPWSASITSQQSMAVSMADQTDPAGSSHPDGMTVLEQIDLMQQAEFFVALGQDEPAIDLLAAHLRGTGGTSPMPYLKLLEVHRQRGEYEAYERIRERFNQRFNGVAPGWDHQGAQRSLETYPHVMAALIKAWQSPVDALALLESLLFRKGAGAEMFDLPAYQDVLFLYQLCHTLFGDSGMVPSQSVDVLLPLMGADDAQAVSVRELDLEGESTQFGAELLEQTAVFGGTEFGVGRGLSAGAAAGTGSVEIKPEAPAPAPTAEKPAHDDNSVDFELDLPELLPLDFGDGSAEIAAATKPSEATSLPEVSQFIEFDEIDGKPTKS